MASQLNNKPLLPVLKEKKRYFLYEIYASAPLPASAGSRLKESLAKTLGSFDAAAAGMLSITYDQDKRRGIIRASNASAGKVRSAMLLINELDRQEVMVRPLLSTGILRKAKQAM